MSKIAQGKRFHLTIDRLRPDGHGEADVPPGVGDDRDRRKVVVPRAMPSERLEVEVVHVGHTIRAEPRRVVEAHSERVTAPCPHHATCSGCPLMVASVDGQRAAKRGWLADLGLDVSEVEGAGGPVWGYRWSCKRVAFGVPGDVHLGSYRQGTHEPADMAGCLVDHPDLVAAADELVRVANELRVLPYDEQKQRGDFRAAWLRRNEKGEVLVALVTGLPVDKSSESRLRDVAARLQRPAGVALAHRRGGGNDLRGEDLVPLTGEAHIDLQWEGMSVEVGPQGFMQPNPRVAGVAHRHLVGDERGGLALDLYAGAGLTTQLLRERFDRVVPCEAYPESAASLGVTPQRAGPFLEAMVSAGEQPDLVVANPPRRGMGEAVCEELRRLRPPVLRIMSCHPVTLARDLAWLEADGVFTRTSVRAFDTLVHTAHVEIVVELRAS